MKRLLPILGMLLCVHPVWAELPAPRSGEVAFEPAENEGDLAEMFQMQADRFAFEETWQTTYSQSMQISLVTFPSLVVTEHASNNTVHCEYFRPLSEGKHPAVVVLHILGGDFELSRTFSRYLADRGVAALFVKMPYYGERSVPGVRKRMVSEDPRETVAGMRQAVLDIRRGAAWLSAQEEVDAKQLGIFGISLGGITASLAAGAEPRFVKVCPMLAGGDIGQVSWNRRELAPLRQRWIDQGGTKESFLELLASVDPVTHAHHVQGRKILMLNAANDEVIPKECTESLWHAFGEPEIVWYDAGHYTAIRFIFDGMERVARFFQPDTIRDTNLQPSP